MVRKTKPGSIASVINEKNYAGESKDSTKLIINYVHDPSEKGG